MCTVTYLPKGNNDFILTSNRDESPTRKTISPQEYVVDGVKLFFPKDEVAGGTWIGLSEKNRLICLLNGGFKIHQREASYKMSRGVIVKMLLTSNDAVAEIENFDFNGIEPFTIVLVDWNNELKTYELVWTGNEKHFKELEQKPHIWSSSTLYTDEMKQLRKEWFADWLLENAEFTQSAVLKFHQNTEKGTPEIAIKMKRINVETVSISSVKKEGKETNFIYKTF